MFYYINNSISIYNYADDCTVSCSGRDAKVIKMLIEEQMECLINWYKTNEMKTNPNKFQAIFSSKDSDVKLNSIAFSDTEICIEPMVELLGVNIDEKLCFNVHIAELCKKAGRKLNVLKRLSNTLNESNKIILFNTFIVSNFNFCSVIWHFCKISDALKIDKIKKRSLQIV